jgi:hypothetical protein
MALSSRATNTAGGNAAVTRVWASSMRQQQQRQSAACPQAMPLPSAQHDPAAVAIALRLGVSVGSSRSSTAQSSRSGSADSAARPAASSGSGSSNGQAGRALAHAAALRKKITSNISNPDPQARLRVIFGRWCRRVLLRRILVPGFRVTEQTRGLILPPATARARAAAGAAGHLQHHHFGCSTTTMMMTGMPSLGSPLALLRLAYRFRIWQYRALRHRHARQNVMPELLRIQRHANFFAAVAAFRQWRAGARLRRNVTALALMRMQTEGGLLRGAMQRWAALAARRKHHRAALRALSSSMYVSRCVLLARCFYRWSKFPAARAERQQRAAQLALLNHKRYVVLTLWRWQRRLRFPSLLDNELRALRVRCRVELLRRYLEAWLRWSCRRMTAVMLEQRTLRRLARRYVRLWRRHTHRQRTALPMLAVLRQAAERRLQVRAFRAWVAWIERGVLAMSLEQKTLVLLLQRYFLEWRNGGATRSSPSQQQQQQQQQFALEGEEEAAVGWPRRSSSSSSSMPMLVMAGDGSHRRAVATETASSSGAAAATSRHLRVLSSSLERSRSTSSAAQQPGRPILVPSATRLRVEAASPAEAEDFGGEPYSPPPTLLAHRAQPQSQLQQQWPFRDPHDGLLSPSDQKRGLSAEDVEDL